MVFSFVVSGNQYFADYPEMIAGKMEMVSGLYGMEAICMAEQSSPLKEQLAEGRWQRAAEEAAKQSVISDFREKTNELLHDIKGQTPEEIEQTVYAYV